MVDKEIESMFYSDVADKKSIARSAVSSARTTSALRKYGISHSYTIKKGRTKTMSVNLHQYISWEKLQSLPADLQEEYLQRIVDTYNIWAKGISKLWLGEISGESVRLLLVKLGIVRSLPVGVKPKPEDVDRFLADYGKPENIGKEETHQPRNQKKEYTKTQKETKGVMPEATLVIGEKFNTAIKFNSLISHSEIEFALTNGCGLEELTANIYGFLQMSVSTGSVIKISVQNNVAHE